MAIPLNVVDVAWRALPRLSAFRRSDVEAHIVAMDDESASCLWMCLRQIGFHHDGTDVREHLLWWLTSPDIFVLGSDKQIASWQERIDEATEQIGFTIEQCCLRPNSFCEVFNWLRAVQSSSTRKPKRKLWQRNQDSFDYGDVMHSRIFFDTVLSLAVTSAARHLKANHLTYQPSLLSRIEGREADPAGLELWAGQELKAIIDHQVQEWHKALFEFKELPLGWEIRGAEARPIRSKEELRCWIQLDLDRLHGIQQREAVAGYDWHDPSHDIEPFRKELRNARRALRALGISRPDAFDDHPEDFDAVEKQLEQLIDEVLLAPTESEPEAPAPKDCSESLFNPSVATVNAWDGEDNKVVLSPSKFKGEWGVDYPPFFAGTDPSSLLTYLEELMRLFQLRTQYTEAPSGPEPDNLVLLWSQGDANFAYQVTDAFEKAIPFVRAIVSRFNLPTSVDSLESFSNSLCDAQNAKDAAYQNGEWHGMSDSLTHAWFTLSQEIETLKAFLSITGESESDENAAPDLVAAECRLASFRKLYAAVSESLSSAVTHYSKLIQQIAQTFETYTLPPDTEDLSHFGFLDWFELRAGADREKLKTNVDNFHRVLSALGKSYDSRLTKFDRTALSDFRDLLGRAETPWEKNQLLLLYRKLSANLDLLYIELVSTTTADDQEVDDSGIGLTTDEVDGTHSGTVSKESGTTTAVSHPWTELCEDVLRAWAEACKRSGKKVARVKFVTDFLVEKQARNVQKWKGVKASTINQRFKLNPNRWEHVIADVIKGDSTTSK